MRKTTNILSLLTVFAFLIGCANEDLTNNKLNLSTDIDGLSNIINLDKYKPTSVKWKYEKALPESNSNRSVLGPDDYKMEAILTFNKKTIKKIKNDYNLSSVEIKRPNKVNFQFDWLPKDINDSIKNYDSSIYDIQFLKKGVHGDFIIIDDNRIVLYFYTA